MEADEPVSDDNGWGEFLRSCESPPEPSGELTGEQLGRWLTQMWDAGLGYNGHAVPSAAGTPIGWNIYQSASERDITLPPEFVTFIPNDEALGRAAGSFAAEVEEYAARQVTCGAALFPLLPRLPRPDVPVHPSLVAYFDLHQGPTPAVCAREPHPGSPWHWADGTWWR